MSVGHIQRVFEAAGLATVGIYVEAFGHVPRHMGVNRALLTRHPMARPLGAPGDHERQLAVVRAALELASTAEPAITTFPERYRTP